MSQGDNGSGDGKDNSSKIFGWISETSASGGFTGDGSDTPFADGDGSSFADDSFWTNLDDAEGGVSDGSPSDTQGGAGETSVSPAPVEGRSDPATGQVSYVGDIPLPPPPATRPTRKSVPAHPGKDGGSGGGTFPPADGEGSGRRRENAGKTDPVEYVGAGDGFGGEDSAATSTYAWAQEDESEDEEVFSGAAAESDRDEEEEAFRLSGALEEDGEEYQYAYEYDMEEEVERRRRKPDARKKTFSGSSHRNDVLDGDEDRVAHSGRGGRGNIFDSGGRWKVLLLRGLVWGVLALLLLLGAKQIIAPEKLDTAAITGSVASQVGYHGFPVAQGENVGQRFLLSYLTFTPGQGNERSDDLKQYLAAGADEDWLTNTVSGSEKVAQSVVAGPYMLMQPLPIDDKGYDLVGQCDVKTSACRAIYTFVAQVSNPQAAAATASNGVEGSPLQWVYITVPMIATSSEATGTQVSVDGAPAFIPPPSGVTQDANISLVQDDAASKELAELLPTFFTAWAASDAAGLKKFIPGDTTVPPTLSQGLGGTVVLYAGEGQDPKTAVKDVAVQALPAGAQTNALRLASVTVTWRNTLTQVVYTQQYRLGVYKSNAEGGSWYIQDMQGGGFKTAYTTPIS